MNDWKGKEMTKDTEYSCRIAFQNIHGIHSMLTPLEHKIHDLVDNMDTYCIDVLGVSEHHLSTGNQKWRKRLADAINTT